MSVFNDKFRKARKDCTPYLFHFINGDDNNPVNTMASILAELKLKSKNEYICFSASPLTSIGSFFETNVNKTGKPMYLPFGIGFCRDDLVRDFGARNVIYYDDNESKLIPEDLKWRALRLNVNSYDFEYLREWRIKGCEFDFSGFPKEHLIVIIPDLQKQQDLVNELEAIKNYTPVSKRKWTIIKMEEVKHLYDDYAVSAITATHNVSIVGDL